MSDTKISPAVARHLNDVARLSQQKILNPDSLSLYGGIRTDAPVLVLLAAGKGTRFGKDPKCIQPVCGVPLARHSVDAFRRLAAAPVVCIVGYRHEQVAGALGCDNIHVRSDDPAGGTAFAVYEAFSVPGLLERNPALIISMGDRIVPMSIFQRLWETHCSGDGEADLTFLTARYEPPGNRGKGRVLRDENRRVVRLIEQRDIDGQTDEIRRQALMSLTEGNCPVYVIRAATLIRHLQDLTNENAQGQYYITDIVERISAAGGEVRTVTTQPGDPEYDLLCADVTRPEDLPALEVRMARTRDLFPGEFEVDEAARAVLTGRPAGQVASIARQLAELMEAASREKLGFKPDQPISLGIAGGRLRIAFMHPDMGRFFGPAWQMSIGAGEAAGDEQIVVLMQEAGDRRIHLYPINPKYRESINHIDGDDEAMFPGLEVSDWHTYEGFGTRMSETLLLSLGYFSDEELDNRRRAGLPLPPPSLWATSNMRRPFALVGNAIASMRTLRDGSGGAKVEQYLGKKGFNGLRLTCTGSIPQGGFSSSSAVTVAVKNAINALFEIGLTPDTLVHLACQAEYGTGVRAGSLDQATEQKGQAGQGTLISSNPREDYRIIGTYPVPAERFCVIFPYSVERDRRAWQWSWGVYGGSTAPGEPLTTTEARKMTGKAAEIAALLIRQPLDVDFFQEIENDLVTGGALSGACAARVCQVLRQLPLLIPREDLRQRVHENRDWFVEALQGQGLSRDEAVRKADQTLESLFAGWRDPVLRRTLADGSTRREQGVPLRAMAGYLFGEVAKNFRLIHHPEQWIECVTLSQRGDRCVEIDPDRLPGREQMAGDLDFEAGLEGPDRLAAWLERCGAGLFDFDAGLDDASLDPADPPNFGRLQGSNFFRGLALIDLAEAMLKRAFGDDAIAVRVNAAGQGDYFQVHIDTHKAEPDEVKTFIREAFYRRFGIAPDLEFVEVRPGGGAAGVRLSRYDLLPDLVQRLRAVTERG